MSLYNKILTKEILEADYKSLRTITAIAKKYEMDISTISKYMNIYNIKYHKHYQPQYKCSNVFATESEASFYLAGFIAADGNIYQKPNSNTYRIKITLSIKDIEHLQLIKEVLHSTHPIHKYNDKMNNESCSISIISKDIFDTLSYFNITPNKTFTYQFPEHLTSHPLIHHFMRGYFDGDGTVSYLSLLPGRTVKQLQLGVRGTFHFLDHFNKILNNYTDISTIDRVKKYDSTYSVNYSGNGNVKKIVNFLYRDSNIFLARKYNIIKHLI